VSEIAEQVKERAEAFVARARRLGPGTLLVRGALYLAGVIAQAVAWPVEVVFARSGLLGWLAATTAWGETPSYWRLVVLAASLYGVHTLAALAAVLPYDAIVSGTVLTRWLLRAGLVVALTVVVAMFTLLVPRYLGDRRYLLASLVGLALMIGLAGYLAALVRRR
jgi:hypothetical protein